MNNINLRKFWTYFVVANCTIFSCITTYSGMNMLNAYAVENHILAQLLLLFLSISISSAIAIGHIFGPHINRRMFRKPSCFIFYTILTILILFSVETTYLGLTRHTHSDKLNENYILKIRDLISGARALEFYIQKDVDLTAKEYYRQYIDAGNGKDPSGIAECGPRCNEAYNSYRDIVTNYASFKGTTIGDNIEFDDTHQLVSILKKDFQRVTIKHQIYDTFIKKYKPDASRSTFYDLKSQYQTVMSQNTNAVVSKESLSLDYIFNLFWKPDSLSIMLFIFACMIELVNLYIGILIRYYKNVNWRLEDETIEKEIAVNHKKQYIIIHKEDVQLDREIHTLNIVNDFYKAA